MKKIKILTVLTVMLSIFLASCYKDNTSSSKKSGFTAPEEYIDNPSVKKAVNESDIPVYYGDTPPALAGTYISDGSVTNVSSLIYDMMGVPIKSEFILSKQTSSGKIDLEERIGGIKITGSGGYITGANGNFTIYIESRQSGSEAGLPSGVSVTVVMMMSGTKLNNGDLSNVQGLTVFTDASSNNSSYDVSEIIGEWYKWKANFYLQTEN